MANTRRPFQKLAIRALPSFEKAYVPQQEVAEKSHLPPRPSIITHRNLLAQLIKHDVLLRYCGAKFFWAWVLLRPLIMCAFFTYFFGE
jgi:hypothetical protein